MSQIIIVLWWWILVAALGLLAWPLAFRLLRFVPDRGYSAARPLGLLLGAFAWWLLGSMGFLTTSLGGALVALALVGAVAAWLYHARRSDDVATLTGWLRQNLGYVLTYEAVFFVAFAGWAYFRAHSPAIDHTEEPMEFAFLNGILRSPGFPPNDPWLSGYGISYYYMGYVMMALLTRVSGTAPAIAYNVMSALWFALFAGGAFGIAYNLVASGKEQAAKGKALFYGVLAAVLLLVMGNLGGAVELAHQNGVGSPGFWSWLDIAELSGPATTGGGLTPQRGSWWWWRASRVINDYTLDGSSQYNSGTTVIDEFPQFSFILGDMHPHVLGLPFALLAITLALNLYCSNFKFQTLRLDLRASGQVSDFKFLTNQQPATSDQQPAISNQQPATSNQQPTTTNDQPSTFHFPLFTFLLYAIALGALGFLNTWDYPLYLALAAAAYGLRRWQEEGSLNRKVVLETGVLGAAVGITGFLLYLPFYLSFESQARGIFPNLFYGTRFSQFFVMFGPFLVIGVCFIVAMMWQARSWVWLSALGWAVTLLIACVVLAPVIGVLSPVGRTYLNAWLRHEPLPGLGADAGSVVMSRLIGRALGTSTVTPLANGTTITVPGSSLGVPLAMTYVALFAVLLWGKLFKPASQPVSQSASQPVSQSASQPATPSTRPSVVRAGLSPALASQARHLASPSHFVLLLFVTGATVVLGLEFVFLGDAFGTRMNTVFKFYYQVWALWSVASAYGVYYVLDRATSGQWLVARAVQAVLIGVMILAGLIYPLMAIPSRGDQNTSTLDGTAYLARENPGEYAAIQWINANVQGSPVILETPGDSFRADTSRVSGYTGLPTLLGWKGHESQWRNNPPIAEREQDISEIYNSRDAEQTLMLLDKYNISYIYVGILEQAQYSPAGLAKFDAMADKVFQQGNVTIYKVRR